MICVPRPQGIGAAIQNDKRAQYLDRRATGAKARVAKAAQNLTAAVERSTLET